MMIISRKVMIIALFIVGLTAFLSKRNTTELSVEIASLSEQRSILEQKVRKLSLRSIPRTDSFDHTRQALIPLGIRPTYSGSVFTYIVSDSSLESLVARLRHIKAVLPNTYVSRLSFDKLSLHAELKTQVGP